MDSLANYQFFLFDFDGLLVNSEHLHYKAYQKMLESFGLELRCTFLEFAAIAHVSSEGLRLYLQENYPQIKTKTWTECYELKQKYYQELLNEGRIQLMPGVEEVLNWVLAGNKQTAVVTNSRQAQVDLICEQLPLLQAIPLWITREDYNRPKPAPDGYLEALRLMDAPVNECIGFEDTLRGSKSLIEAKIKAILICDPHHPQMSDPLAASLPHFNSFHALLEAENLKNVHSS